MDKYTIITENDVSEWNDETGARYHFPNKYKKNLTPGTNVIYYKGGLKNKSYRNHRLMDEPHYFGYGIIGNVYTDEENTKNFYAEIEDYTPFTNGVYFKKDNDSYFEDVSKSNYWRDGVREINVSIFNAILNIANIEAAQYGDFISDDVEIEITHGTLIKYRDRVEKQTFNYTPINLKKIGDRGEKLVITYLEKNLHADELKTLRWLANEGETPGYDIEFLNLNQEKVCIEVKSTTASKFPYFHLTINEYSASQRNKLYYIYLVTNCNSKKPKIEILDNPFTKDNFTLEPIAFKVYQLD